MRLRRGQRYRAIVNVDAPRFLVTRGAVAAKFEAIGFEGVLVQLTEPADVDAWTPPAPIPGESAATATSYERSGDAPGWRAYVEGVWARDDGDFSPPRPIAAAWPVDDSGRAHAPAGGIMPTYVSRQTVLDFVRKLDPAIQAFGDEVRDAKKQASASWQSNFGGWRARWAEFRNECEGTFVMLDAVSRLETAEAYADDLESFKKSWTRETGQVSGLPAPGRLPSGGPSFPTFLGAAVVLGVVVGILTFAKGR